MKKKTVKKTKRKAPKKYKKRTTTSRQTKAKQNILENHRSQRSALKAAGYSQAYADHPAEFKNTKAGQELIATCNSLRDKSLKHAEDMIKKASYGDSVRGADTLNKMSRLEDDKATDNTKVSGVIILPEKNSK